MRVSAVVCVFAFSLCLAACGGGQSNSTASVAASATAPPTAAATVTAAPESATPTAEPTAGGTAAPTPTPTPNPNLLDTSNGTLLRSYSPATLDGMNDGNLSNAANGIGSELPDAAKPPFVFTFEMPTIATITGFQADLRGQQTNGPVPSVDFAVSTTGPDGGFTDVGTISGTAKTLAANTKARWVRVTANQLFDSVGATGSFAPPPAGLNPTGFYVEDTVPDKNGGYVATGTRTGDDRARFVMVGSALVANECTQDGITGVYIGHLQGRNWNAHFAGNKDENANNIRAVVNDDASIIAGTEFGGPVYFSRTGERPAFCVARTNGTGAHHVLVLDKDPIGTFAPSESSPPPPGYTFDSIGAGMLDAGELNGHETVITRQICAMNQVMAREQRALLLQWVAAGHKLIIGGGQCDQGSDFTWLPYPFKSAGSGPESTNAGLILVEDNALGTRDKSDTAHFVDVAALAADGNNDLANAATVTSTDPHWCGHLFVAKTTNLNGFVQTYASDGGGLMIYDGFNGDEAQPVMVRIRQLELDAPVPGSFPCSQNITDAFLLEPSQEASFNAGTAQTIRVPMEILANQGWNGQVSIKTNGSFPATVTPASFNLAGGTQNVTVAIAVPAAAKAGEYTVNVVADNGSGKTAQASVSLTGNEELKKAITPTQRRIRIYGIHFDVDSAVIQPDSQPVIAQIAEVMRANPTLRFQVEGYTDSDGGAAYNLGLSQRRAQSVVNDLIEHFGIARTRLVAKGFGMSDPVASNSTPAGKALNRRVELLRL